MEVDSKESRTEVSLETVESDENLCLKEKKDKEDEEKFMREYKRPCADRKCPGMNHPDALKCETCNRVEFQAGHAYEFGKPNEDSERKKAPYEPINANDLKGIGTVPSPFADYVEVASMLKKEYKEKAESPFFKTCPGMGDLAGINTWVGNCLPLTEAQKRDVLVDVICDELVKKDGQLRDSFLEVTVREHLKKQEWDWDPDRSEKTDELKKELVEEVIRKRALSERESVKKKDQKSKEEKREEDIRKKILERRKKREENREKRTKRIASGCTCHALGKGCICLIHFSDKDVSTIS